MSDSICPDSIVVEARQVALSGKAPHATSDWHVMSSSLAEKAAKVSGAGSFELLLHPAATVIVASAKTKARATIPVASRLTGAP
jgi:hypothetical protein